MMWCQVSVATCLNMNEGVKTAQRWCRGSKIQNIKNLFRVRKLLILQCAVNPHHPTPNHQITKSQMNGINEKSY